MGLLAGDFAGAGAFVVRGGLLVIYFLLVLLGRSLLLGHDVDSRVILIRLLDVDFKLFRHRLLVLLDVLDHRVLGIQHFNAWTVHFDVVPQRFPDRDVPVEAAIEGLCFFGGHPLSNGLGELTVVEAFDLHVLLSAPRVVHHDLPLIDLLPKVRTEVGPLSLSLIDRSRSIFDFVVIIEVLKTWQRDLVLVVHDQMIIHDDQTTHYSGFLPLDTLRLIVTGLSSQN